MTAVTIMRVPTQLQFSNGEGSLHYLGPVLPAERLSCA